MDQEDRAFVLALLPADAHVYIDEHARVGIMLATDKSDGWIGAPLEAVGGDPSGLLPHMRFAEFTHDSARAAHVSLSGDVLVVCLAGDINGGTYALLVSLEDCVFDSAPFAG